MVGKYPPDKHGDIPMAEFASRRESVDKPSSKRDPQLQQIMDLTIVNLKEKRAAAAAPSTSALAHSPAPENTRLAKYKR